MSDSYIAPSNVVSRTGAGVVSGLGAGVVLGVILWLMDELDPIGGLVNAASLTVTWTFLLLVCAIAGGLYGMFLGRFISGQIVSAVGVGVFFGALMWVLVELIAVSIDRGKLSAGSHGLALVAAFVVFGVVLGIVYAITGPRRRYYAHYGRRLPWGFAYPAALPRPRRRRSRRDD
jgi:hypothetical protein